MEMLDVVEFEGLLVGVGGGKLVVELVDFMLDAGEGVVEDFMNIPYSIGYPVLSLNLIFFNGFHQLQVKRMIFGRLLAHVFVNS